MGDKQSYTQKPCHGCGERRHRRADELCYECKALLERAEALVKNEQARGDVYNYSSEEYSPRYFFNSKQALADHLERSRHLTSEHERALSKAMWALIRAVSAPSGKYESGGPVFPHRQRGNITWNAHSLRMGIASALTGFDARLVEYIQCVYASGWRDGADLLSHLASGKLSVEQASELTLAASRPNWSDDDAD